MASKLLKVTQSPTLRATARSLGVSLSSLQNAISTGRVSVDADGRVPDLEHARSELAANTAPTHPKAAARIAAPDAHDPESRAEALRRRAVAEAGLKELALGEARALLIPANQVERLLVDAFTSAKAHLLTLPSRAKQSLPHLSHSDLEALEGIVREALTELADGKAGTSC